MHYKAFPSTARGLWHCERPISPHQKSCWPVLRAVHPEMNYYVTSLSATGRADLTTYFHAGKITRLLRRVFCQAKPKFKSPQMQLPTMVIEVPPSISSSQRTA